MPTGLSPQSIALLMGSDPSGGMTGYQQPQKPVSTPENSFGFAKNERMLLALAAIGQALGGHGALNDMALPFVMGERARRREVVDDSSRFQRATNERQRQEIAGERQDIRREVRSDVRDRDAMRRKSIEYKRGVVEASGRGTNLPDPEVDRIYTEIQAQNTSRDTRSTGDKQMRQIVEGFGGKADEASIRRGLTAGLGADRVEEFLPAAMDLNASIAAQEAAKNTNKGGGDETDPSILRNRVLDQLGKIDRQFTTQSERDAPAIVTETENEFDPSLPPKRSTRSGGKEKVDVKNHDALFRTKIAYADELLRMGYPEEVVNLVIDDAMENRKQADIEARPKPTRRTTERLLKAAGN